MQYGFQKELIFNVIKGSSEIWFNVMHKRKLEFLALVGLVLNYDCNNNKLKRVSEFKCEE